MIEGQRPEQDSVDEGEDAARRADAQGEGQDDREAGERPAAKLPESLADLTCESVHRSPVLFWTAGRRTAFVCRPPAVALRPDHVPTSSSIPGETSSSGILLVLYCQVQSRWPQLTSLQVQMVSRQVQLLSRRAMSFIGVLLSTQAVRAKYVPLARRHVEPRTGTSRTKTRARAGTYQCPRQESVRFRPPSDPSRALRASATAPAARPGRLPRRRPPRRRVAGSGQPALHREPRRGPERSEARRQP